MIEVLVSKRDNNDYRQFIVISHLIRRINMNSFLPKEYICVPWSIEEGLSSETITYSKAFFKRQFSLDTQPSFW
jgi:hypothetical protein